LHDKTPTYSHDIDDGDCNESINMTFSVETMKKFLAKNEDWDIKIGYGEPFSLEKREKAKIKTFIKALEKNGS